jgi:sugar/nucleoside kinase (ribokinase family)
VRIGIIGQPCIDEIVHLDDDTPDHPTRHAIGGILYSYAAMERMMREADRGDQFVPHMWLSGPDRWLLDPALDSYRHIDRQGGLWPTDVPTNRVFLVYDERGERTANCPNVLPTLTERELTPQLIHSLDALFINMISGHDVSIDTLEAVLSKAELLGSRPYVHVDVHALVLADLSEKEEKEILGLGGFGYRHEPRGVREWKRWLQMADSIQLNELEARWFADPDLQSEEELTAYAREMRDTLRLSSLIITRAERGATLYDTRRDETHHVPIPAVKIQEPTGSGDVFGAAYTFAIASGKPRAESLREAVEWATWNATLLTLDELLTAER